MTDSPGQVSLLRSVETGDLSVPKDRIWLSSDQPPVQLLHHQSEPSRSHKSPLACAPLWHPKSRACRAATELASSRRIACHLVLPTRRAAYYYYYYYYKHREVHSALFTALLTLWVLRCCFIIPLSYTMLHSVSSSMNLYVWFASTHRTQDTQTCFISPVTLTSTRWPRYMNLKYCEDVPTCRVSE